MASNLQKKPFLDYQAQIKYLKQKQLAINDEDCSPFYFYSLYHFIIFIPR